MQYFITMRNPKLVLTYLSKTIIAQNTIFVNIRAILCTPANIDTNSATIFNLLSQKYTPMIQLTIGAYVSLHSKIVFNKKNVLQFFYFPNANWNISITIFPFFIKFLFNFYNLTCALCSYYFRQIAFNKITCWRKLFN